jgi:small subunit ribosomal protein S2e
MADAGRGRGGFGRGRGGDRGRGRGRGRRGGRKDEEKEWYVHRCQVLAPL